MDFTEVDRILEKYDFNHENIIAILQEVQEIDKHLTEDVLRYISKKIEMNLAKIFDVVTFYTGFSLKSKGRHIVKVCNGTPCHLGGAARNLERLEKHLNIKEGEMTPDRVFSLETINCPGTCALAPVLMVDEEYYESVDPDEIGSIINSHRSRSKGENK